MKKLYQLPAPVAAVTLLTGLVGLSVRAHRSGLEERVNELETWRDQANGRIERLESMLTLKGSSPVEQSLSDGEKVVSVTVTGKRFDPAKPRSGKYEDNIWWDAEYSAIGLEKPARSIKGTLKFCDLFGDPRFRVQVTIDDTLEPNGSVRTRGVGIKYNQFLESHGWLRTTELSNMTFRFEAAVVLYEDGTAARFE